MKKIINKIKSNLITTSSNLLIITSSNLLIITSMLISTSSFAQAPQKMSYQAVIRNTSNILVTNTAVGMRVSILQGSSTGTPVYVETQTPTTNANGLSSIEIGSGTVVSGNFSAINWAAGPYFIKTETDPTGGTSYSITGNKELISVPYALFSANGGATGNNGTNGFTGATGATGNGTNGYTGATGNDGNIGSTGATGMGTIGATGATGSLTSITAGTGLTGGTITTSGTIALSVPVSIANGGSNSTTALSGSSIIISDGSAMIQGAAGTATTVLHGNAAGAPSYSPVNLATDVINILPIANGGTGCSAIPTAGAAAYGTGTCLAFTAAGASGQVLTSSGLGAPSWQTPTPSFGGSGTTNYVSKFTPNGTTLGNSLIFDNGTNVGIGTATPSAMLTVLNGNSIKSAIVQSITDVGTAPTTVASANYLQLGQNEGGTNSYRLIGFGYNSLLAGNSPAYLGYQETTSSNYTNGDLVFGTRSVTTNTVASERMRITSSGNVGINTSTPNATAQLHVDLGSSTTNGILVTGTAVSGTIPDLGGGSRMMFYPGKGAFRAGYVNGTQWDNANVGSYSTAIGYNDTAKGYASIAMGQQTTASGMNGIAMGYSTAASGGYSTAMGNNTTASGNHSTAMGFQTTASGNYSTAMGNNTTASGNYSTALGGYGTTASGNYSTAMGYSTTASGGVSTAIGYNTLASGLYSTAIGNSTIASGLNSTAIGYNNIASGYISTAMGSTNTASGDISIAMGVYTTSPSYAETVIGQYNTSYTPISSTIWNSADRLFVVGNGTASGATANAVTVLKNGNVGIGTSTPSKALLEVNGSQSNTLTYEYLSPSGTGSTSGTANYSIYASQRIAAMEFNAYSDARIKKVIDVSNNAADLNTLLSIRIKDYKYIDTLSKDNRVHKKLIAQELESVYPNAVSKIKDEVPDIFKIAEIKNGRITIANNLKAGEKVKLIFDKHTELAEVIEADANSFKVSLTDEGRVFVYGRQVTDFRVVDYEALSTLSISAIQEQQKMIEKLKTENTNFKAELENSKKENSEFKNKFIKIENELDEIQKRNVSAKKE